MRELTCSPLRDAEVLGSMIVDVGRVERTGTV